MSPGQRTVPWKKVQVFVSSTFDDMHAERDFLVKRVFPQLADWCERRRLRLVDVDLRWGVTEENATRNKNVAEVCLRRIDECRPFFLCFLGQRYGWVPRCADPEDSANDGGDISPETLDGYPGLRAAVEEERSLTELEILHAVACPFHLETGPAGESVDPARHAYFFLREDSYLPSLEASHAYLRRKFSDSEERDAENRGFLLDKNRKLRDEVVPATGRPIVFYQAEWSDAAESPELALPLACQALLPENVERWTRRWREAAGIDSDGGEIDSAQKERAVSFNREITRGRLTGFQADGRPLENVVLETLRQAIVERYPDHLELEEDDELQSELDQQDQFVSVSSEGFIRRQGDFDELDAYVESDSRRLFVLTAPGGMGKSTLLANWITRRGALLDRPAGESLHYRFIGQSDGSTTVESLMRLLLEEFRATTGKLGEEIPTDPQQLRHQWLELLAAVGRRGKTILVIDALSQLETGLADLGWLPRELPAGIRLIASFKRGDEAADNLFEEMREDERVQLSAVKPFESLEDRGHLVEAYLARCLKELDRRHIEDLIRSDGAENPLFLKVVLSELRVFGAFANLGEKIRRDFGTDPVSAFDAVLARLELDPAYSAIAPREAVPLLFGLLAHARRGLSDEELTGLMVQILDLGRGTRPTVDAADTVHLFLRQVRPFLARRKGRYDFFFESFLRAARERYVGDPTAEAPARCPEPTWHTRIADYFEAQDLDERKVDELPWQLSKAGDWDRQAALLADPAFFGVADGLREYEILAYWAEVERRSGHRLVDAYRSLVRDPAGNPAVAAQLWNLLLRTGHVRDAAELLQGLTSAGLESGAGDPLARIGFLGGQAHSHYTLGELDESLELWNEVERLSRELGNKTALSGSLGGQALIHHDRGELDRALELLEGQERLSRELGDRALLCSSLGNQGNVLSDRGDFDEALRLFDEVTRLCEELGDQDKLLATLANRGNIHKARGELDQAMRLYRKEESLCRELGKWLSLSSSLNNQGLILEARGQLDEAMRLFKEVEKLCRELGDPVLLAKALGNQALVLHARGELEAALELWKEDERLSREAGHLAGVKRSLKNQSLTVEILASRSAEAGDPQGALELLRRLEATAREVDDKDTLQMALGNQANLLDELGDPEAAFALQKECERLCRELGSDEGLLRSLNNQALLLMQANELDEAEGLLAQVEELCDGLGPSEELATCRFNQAMIMARTERFDEALRLLHQSEETRLEIGDFDKAGNCQMYQVVIALREMRQPERAVEPARRARQLAERHDLGEIKAQLTAVIGAFAGAHNS